MRLFEVTSRQIWIEIDGKMVNRRGYLKSELIPLLRPYPRTAARPLDPAETLDISRRNGPSDEAPRRRLKWRNPGALAV